MSVFLSLSLRHPEFGISLGDTTNKRSFQAFLTGPEGTPFHTGLFTVDVRMPRDYPMSLPKINFETTCFYPNIKPGCGRVCVDVLNVADEWTPTLTLKQSLESVQDLLANPNPFSPLNDLAAVMLRQNKDMYEKSARAFTFFETGGKTVLLSSGSCCCSFPNLKNAPYKVGCAGC